MLGRLSGGSWFSKLVDLSWIGVAIGGRFYLLFALGLNVFLLFRRQTSIWLKALVWALFVVFVLGVLGVETELKHVRH